MNNNPVVFISYSNKLKVLASHVKPVLEINGIECWIAPDSIPAGTDYASVIQEALENCLVFVLLLSENSQNSIWVTKELEQALNLGKTVCGPFSE